MTYQDLTEAATMQLHLSKEDILSQIQESRIWKVTLGFEPKEGDCISSPFRKDNSPGCKFVREGGLLKLTDWASIGSKVNGVSIFSVDCFQSIQILNNIPLSMVYSRLQKAIDNSKDIEIGEIETPKIITTRIKKKKEESYIFYWRRKWNKWDYDFWSPYEITRKQLDEDGIAPINAWAMQKKGKETKKYTCNHWNSYVLNDISWKHRLKIYQPYSKSMKFFGNVNKDDIGGLYTLKEGNSPIIITKSYKDYRVLKNAGYNVIWFQNEGMLPDLNKLKKHKHRKFLILFDNDKAGIKAAYKIRNLMRKAGFKTKAMCLNRNFYKFNDVKDPSDLIKNRKEIFHYIFSNGKKPNDEKIHKGRKFKLLETIPEKIHGL